MSPLMSAVLAGVPWLILVIWVWILHRRTQRQLGELHQLLLDERAKRRQQDQLLLSGLNCVATDVDGMRK